MISQAAVIVSLAGLFICVRMLILRWVMPSFPDYGEETFVDRIFSWLIAVPTTILTIMLMALLWDLAMQGAS